MTRQLGYPTKNFLRALHEGFQKSGELQANYVHRKSKYLDELGIPDYRDRFRVAFGIGGHDSGIVGHGTGTVPYDSVMVLRIEPT